MATITLSPTPAPIAAMSSRRGPLTSNPHAANSPLRAPSALFQNGKVKRSYANTQREETYGQPPPIKKQVLEDGTSRAVRSPSKLPRSQQLPQRTASQVAGRPPIKERTTSRLPTVSRTVQDDEHKEVWKKHYRAKFPKMVFYFESIPDDVRAKLTKRVIYLGASQEPFFSNTVTHVITTRPIPTERSESQVVEEPEPEPEPEEQPQTINPSLLDRNPVARRKLLYEFRNVPSKSQQTLDPTKPNRAPRNNDVLYQARKMGKKIWSLEKFQSMVSVLLEAEQPQQQGGQAARTVGLRNQDAKPQNQNLLQLLHNERIHGPSDRDLSTSNKELSYFKGPFIYVWDMDEKHKPILVREYTKVANKADGDWPQFRSVGNGRCPFVEEVEIPQKEERKAQAEAKAQPAPKREASVAPAPLVLKAPEAPAPKAVTGKRSLAEMEDGQNRGTKLLESLHPAKATLSKQAFISRAVGGRLFHGEPVASGVQASNVTSAIRSQMISSTSGLSGVKAGTSKEIHGLQRKVLQKAAPASNGTSSRATEHSMDATSSRPMTLSRQTSKVSQSKEETSQKAPEHARTQSQPLKSKKDLKPGYCENCQDKFRDFDEHILSRKHRKFAENDENWTELDTLLKELTRMPKDAEDIDY